MGISGLIFLSSGLFLGWSLGANDASNVFGTAVATRMVKFKTAAIVCSIFIALGAVIGGVGAAHTLGSLGKVNAIGGSFVTAFAAAFMVYSMNKVGLPVSVSQAVVGAIIGWNWFTDSVTDMDSLVKIAGTWVACPLIAAGFAIPLFACVKKIGQKVDLSLLQRDALTRTAMILTGAFGAYALGANNMANVVGVFIPVVPFRDFNFFGFEITAVHQLFFIGSVAASVGVYTYSYRVMMTVGNGLMPLSPFAAWVVVMSQSLVLFIFASEGLEYFLVSHGLPSVPLVPVSSTQAVVGAVLGIGLLKGGKNIKWSILGRIVSGWVTTPLLTACFCFFSLFIMQNVFNQPVYTPRTYIMSPQVLKQLEDKGILADGLSAITGKTYHTEQAIIRAVKERLPALTNEQEKSILAYSEVWKIRIDPSKIKKLPENEFSPEQMKDIEALSGKTFEYRWELKDALAALNPVWSPLPDTVLNKQKNKEIAQQFQILEGTFKWVSQD
ncbi:MAG: inorganic phosphate transporter [Alphaproteobacteria bacterium]